MVLKEFEPKGELAAGGVAGDVAGDVPGEGDGDKPEVLLGLGAGFGAGEVEEAGSWPVAVSAAGGEDGAGAVGKLLRSY